MHATSRQLLLSVLAALSFGLAPYMRSQEPTEAPVAPAETTAIDADNAPNAPNGTNGTNGTDGTDGVDAPVVSDAQAAAPVAEESEPPLRELGTEVEEVETDRRTRGPRRSGSRSQGGSSERVVFGQDITLAEGETASELVAIVGSATVEGDVRNAVVSILGNTHVTGTVGGEVVAVLGSVYINNRVGGEVVAVMGNVELGPLAEVNGQIVVIGGILTRDPDAVVRRGVQNIGIGGRIGDAEWLAAYFRECVLKLRPLAFSADVAWAWGVAFAFLAFYVLLALLFRRGVEKCEETLQTRPGYSVLAALLTVLLVPVAMGLLVFTVIGLALVPFLGAALFFGSLFGKAVMLAWLGRRITSAFGNGPYNNVAVAVLLGGLIVMLLYVVPVFGFLLFKVLAWIGLGVVVYTLVLMSGRDQPPPLVAATPVGGPPPAAGPSPVYSVGPEISGMAAGGTEAAGMAAVAPPISATSAGFGVPAAAGATLLPAISAATLPRAGLMIRLGALLLDVILVSLVLGLMSSWGPRGLGIHPGPGMLPILALYGALMWKLKGTTVGGIICGLKVVRIDNREIDWSTAIVRALGCFLSLAVAGLGFIWVAIDEGRQSWHDKIAGTTVVRVPKGVSLI